MVTAGNYAASYAKALFIATRPHDAVAEFRSIIAAAFLDQMSAST